MKLKYALMSIVLLCSLSACEKNHIDDNQMEPIVYIINSGLVPATYYDVEEIKDCSIYTYCSGFEGGNTEVSVALDAEALDDYNALNGTSFKLLDVAYYSITTAKGQITKSGRRTTLSVRLDCEQLKSLPDAEEYVIPLSLASSATEVNSDKRTILIQPVEKVTALKVDGAGVMDVNLAETGDGNTLEYKFTVVADGFDNKWDCDLDVISGQAALDKYNVANSTIFKTLPADAYSVSTIDNLAAGQNMTEATITVDKAKIPADGIYSVGLCLNSASKFKVDAANNTLVVRFVQPITTGVKSTRANWSLVSASSYQNGYGAEKMWDGTLTTSWLNRWSGGVGDLRVPYTVVIDMGETVTVCGFEMYRRNDKYAADTKAGYYELSVDGVKWYRGANYDFGPTSVEVGPFCHYCEDFSARYLKLVVSDSNRKGSSNDSSGVSELNVFTR